MCGRNSSADTHSFAQPSNGGAPVLPPPPPTKNRKDYPKIPYWHRHEWRHANKSVQKPGVAVLRGPTRAAQGINVSMCYISDQDGVVINGYEASAMRKTFREFCVYLWSCKRAPKTWSRDADPWVKERYHALMNAHHPVLQYCDSGWWAEEIALENYSQWRKKYIQYLAKHEKRKAAKHDMKKKQRKNQSKKNRKGKENRDGTEESSNEDEILSSDHEDNHGLDVKSAKLLSGFFDEQLYTIPRDPEASEVPSSAYRKRSSDELPDAGLDELPPKRPRPLAKTGEASIAHVGSADGRAPGPPSGLQPPTSTATCSQPSPSPAARVSLLSPPSLPTAPLPLPSSLSPVSLLSLPSLLSSPSLPSPLPLPSSPLLPSPLSPPSSPSPVNTSIEQKELCVPDPFADMWGGSKDPVVEEVMPLVIPLTTASVAGAGDSLVPVKTTATTAIATTATQGAVLAATASTTGSNVVAAGSAMIKPEPRSKGKQVVVWPPASRDGVKLKPKEACAVMWARQNPAGTKQDFNKWYVKRSQAVCKAYTKDGIDRAMD